MPRRKQFDTKSESLTATPDTLTVENRQLTLTNAELPLDAVELDKTNPRIKYRLSLEADGGTLDDVIMQMPEVAALKRDIEATGGLRERILVESAGKGRWVVREGNCRLACFRALAAAAPDDDRWRTIPVRVLPENITRKELDILLSDMHVAQKISWAAHEKAGHIYHMVHDQHMPVDEVAMYMRSSKGVVNRLLNAYRFMTETFVKFDGGRYAKVAERKWSYFDELFKRGELVERLEDDAFVAQVCHWIGDAVLPKATDVRQLGAILRVPAAKAALEDDDFDRAVNALTRQEPQETSDFFKLVDRLAESCTAKAQIEDVLLVKNEPAIRERVIAAYNALGEFIGVAMSGKMPAAKRTFANAA